MLDQFKKDGSGETGLSGKQNGAGSARTLKMGSYSVFLTLIVIAIVIVVNLLVGELPSTLTKIDASSGQIYTLSETSISFVKGLREEVTLYYVVTGGNEDIGIQEMLQRYEAYSSRIKLVTVDPTVRPAFVSKYSDSNLTDNSVIVESAKRYTVVPYSDLYVTEYSDEDYYNYYTTGVMPTGTQYFYGESRLTTAIDYVTSDDLPVLYCTTGHGERQLSDTVAKDIKSENIMTETLSLLSAAGSVIPEDAGAVLVNVPTSDFSEEELATLQSYLNRGGKVILITAFEYIDPETMPNLTALAKACGLQAQQGLLLEGNARYYYMYPYYCMPTLNTSSSLASNLASTGITPILMAPHGILTVEASGWTPEPILTTSSDAYVKVNYETVESVEKEEGDPSGEFYLGIASQNTQTGATLLWYSSPYFVEDTLYSYNGELFMSNLTVLCEKTNSISIVGKSMQVQALGVSSAGALFWGIVLILILPLGCLAAGLIVWSKRRKR
ncbi:MAG: GldG family protein [Clostridia bacterium]|nr:GldG family protein [Clostridia bacterium]